MEYRILGNALMYVAYASLDDKLTQNTLPEPMSGCWIWIGNQALNGYGTLNIKNAGGRHKVKLAHRVMWERLRGAIPVGLQLDHKCRVRACVNPAHLEPVTRMENILRGNGASAINARKTCCPKGHAYAPENTYFRPGVAKRECRACKREKARRRTKEGVAS